MGQVKHRNDESSDPHRELRDASRGVRLHKAIADAGVASRRAAEQLIAEGRVSVNGHTVRSMPIWVDPNRDRVEVDGSPIAHKVRRGHTYLLVYKNRGVICTSSDPEGRTKITDLVPHSQRLFCVGRLDSESTGLVLLTDDGELANGLTHPRFGVPKTYEVSVKGQLSPGDLQRLNEGSGVAEKTGRAPRTGAAGVRIVSSDGERTKLLITLRVGRSRQVRPMLERLGFRVRKVRRVALGPLKLKGVAPGQWRELRRDEVGALRKAAGR